MTRAVLDTTVLVSALIARKPGGASYDLLRLARQGTFELCLSDDILEETARTLRESRLRDRYEYSDEDIIAYCHDLAAIGTLVTALPELHGVVPRDPNDDVIVACALGCGAGYVVTRDKDLLSLEEYEGIAFVPPEDFLALLRA